MSRELFNGVDKVGNHIEPWATKRPRGSVLATVASVVSIPVAPVVGAMCIAPSLGTVGGALAGAGLMVGAIGSFLALQFRRDSQSWKNKLLWRDRVIEELKLSSGIELTVDEFKRIGYPEKAPSGSHLVLGSIDKFLPGGESGFELHRVTLISTQGEISLICSKLNSKDLSAITA